ncbi:hypothetical protein CgunFtcFv8_005535 [Champsocephalus gunnari]|uniref:Uncharacterized protein n=1 Tax=Champsocephalus gunnari TaxID=52237 RepID=A0AAN8CVR7_CHAGU|nr:hypothetical protein CgunFtcFv8_005535 [Champsocephalus gunnari]
MLRYLCCCFSSGESADERQSVLHPGPSDLNEAGSARQSRSAHSDAQTVKRIGQAGDEASVCARVGPEVF